MPKDPPPPLLIRMFKNTPPKDPQDKAAWLEKPLDESAALVEKPH